jgi:hypothetical protein
LSEADVERIVFDPASRVIDVGRRTRFYRGALRHAIEIRDRTCGHPTCDHQPERPEIDHIDQYNQGGTTTETNGRLRCRYHNTHRTTPDPDPPHDHDPRTADTVEPPHDQGHDPPRDQGHDPPSV